MYSTLEFDSLFSQAYNYAWIRFFPLLIYLIHRLAIVIPDPLQYQNRSSIDRTIRINLRDTLSGLPPLVILLLSIHRPPPPSKSNLDHNNLQYLASMLLGEQFWVIKDHKLEEPIESSSSLCIEEQMPRHSRDIAIPENNNHRQ